MPGDEKTNIDLTVEEGVLSVRGRLDFSKYKNLQPLSTLCEKLPAFEED
jgi:HSP20 family molecular chaperone IbpA